MLWRHEWSLLPPEIPARTPGGPRAGTGLSRCPSCAEPRRPGAMRKHGELRLHEGNRVAPGEQDRNPKRNTITPDIGEDRHGDDGGNNSEGEHAFDAPSHGPANA